MDMKSLKRAADGNPEQLIAVKRSLLADAYACIKTLQANTDKPSKATKDDAENVEG